jgi:hypothetical protein
VALGPPPAVVSPGTAFAGVHSPFNAAFAEEDLVVFGRGGSITLQLATPVAVGAGPEVGVFTSAGLPDQDFPNGLAADPARTFAFEEYGAERTAVVEVAQTPGNFVSVGRVTFDIPTNYYANATSPYQFPPPDPAVVADFGTPYTGGLAAFSGKTYAQIREILDGSAGGTWVDVRAGAGVSQVNFVRFSDPLWRLPDGTLAETRTSGFDPSFVKPADLFVDAVSGVPEPARGVVVALAGAGLLGRRRRRTVRGVSR